MIGRPDAKCPSCDSLERHRFAWTFLQRETDLLDGRPKRLLHPAPERGLARLFRTIPGVRWISGDLHPRGGDTVGMDLTRLPFADRAFDAIYCSHVLEHVPDDRTAMRELRRVLAPSGWAVLSVPLTAERTDEDPSVMDPGERLHRFGQRDHVRRYGADFGERLREAGLGVREWRAEQLLSPEELREMAIPSGETLWFCRRA